MDPDRRSGDGGQSVLKQTTPAGRSGLLTRRLALWGIALAHRLGTHGGALLLLVIGGFVPVLGRWLRDEIELRRWSEVIQALGGVDPKQARNDPNADLGPVIGRSDAPALFEEVEGVARRLGVRPPGQVRLTYLPCCGVLAWGTRSRALVLGLPLLYVLDRTELRAILGHELAHFARGDATQSARLIHYFEALGRDLDHFDSQRTFKPGGPLGAWARLCQRAGGALLAPMVLGQEARADRAAAAIAGGDATASALVKVALVQPLFREVLDHYDPDAPQAPNLYAFFRNFWDRLPEPILTAMRHRLLVEPSPVPDVAHPALLDRLAIVQEYRSLGVVQLKSAVESSPASVVLGDLEAIEQMLHNRLFGAPAIEPSVFHRAGT